MASRRVANWPASRSVFINCPFDDGFTPIFRAIVFTIASVDHHPRCALDFTDGAEVRISKIAAMISNCDWGIHDLTARRLDPLAQLSHSDFLFAVRYWIALHGGSPPN